MTLAAGSEPNHGTPGHIASMHNSKTAASPYMCVPTKQLPKRQPLANEPTHP